MDMEVVVVTAMKEKTRQRTMYSVCAVVCAKLASVWPLTPATFSLKCVVRGVSCGGEDCTVDLSVYLGRRGDQKGCVGTGHGDMAAEVCASSGCPCGRCGSNRCSTWACVVEMGNVGVAGKNGTCRCHVTIGEGMRDKRCSQDDAEKVVLRPCVLFPDVTSVRRCPQGLCLCAYE